MSVPPAPCVLTPHELDVLRRIAGGATYADVAAALVMTEKGVAPTASRIIRKLGARNMTHAVYVACRLGILDGRPQRHGDHAGYEAHNRRGETACEACRVGERAYRNAQRAARRAAAAADVVGAERVR